MIAPNMIGLTIFYVAPIFETFFYSLTKYKGLMPPHFIGTQNYATLFSDKIFLQSMVNTGVFTVINLPAVVILSVVVSVLLNNKLRGIGLFRTLYFLPYITLPAAVAMVWMFIYNGDYGIINRFLAVFRLPTVYFLSNARNVLPSLAVINIWGSTGFYVILLLAGLQNIPQQYYEAAAIDGAGSFTQFQKITLPLLSPTLFMIIVYATINSLQVFDIIYLTVGPTSPVYNNAQTLIAYFFNVSFVQYDKGLGAAAAVVLFAIIMILTVIQLLLQKKWVVYD